jgi:hypothetical protein
MSQTQNIIADQAPRTAVQDGTDGEQATTISPVH